MTTFFVEVLGLRQTKSLALPLSTTITELKVHLRRQVPQFGDALQVSFRGRQLTQEQTSLLDAGVNSFSTLVLHDVLLKGGS